MARPPPGVAPGAVRRIRRDGYWGVIIQFTSPIEAGSR